MYVPSIFRHAYRFIVLNYFTAPNLLEYLSDLVGAIGGSQNGYALSDHFFRLVSIDALGSLVPAGNGAIEVFTEDRVLRGIDDGGKSGSVFTDLLGTSSMEFFVRPPQFLGDSYAVADVADGTQDEPPGMGGNRAQTDFDGELRAVAASGIEVQIGAHAAGLWRSCKFVAMLVMLRPIRFRNENFHFLAYQLVAVIAKKFLNLGVGLNHNPVPIDRDSGIRQSLQKLRGEDWIIRICLQSDRNASFGLRRATHRTNSRLQGLAFKRPVNLAWVTNITKFSDIDHR